MATISSPLTSIAPPRELWRNGLWQNNIGLVQLLGLCPLLAVSTKVVHGLSLGLATTIVMMISGILVALTRRWIRPEIRIAVFVLIIAASVSTIELLIHAFAYPLYGALGIFLPLIVTNCAILARAETFASRQRPGPALVDGLAMGLGFTWVLVVMGGVRELVGHGTLLANLDHLAGPGAARLMLDLSGVYGGFLPALLPPGAFLTLALLVAAHRHLRTRHDRLSQTTIE